VSADESRVAIASHADDGVRVVVRDLESGKLIEKPVEITMPILGLGFAGERLRVIGKGREGERCPAPRLREHDSLMPGRCARLGMRRGSALRGCRA
jgi:hypothetical protein